MKRAILILLVLAFSAGAAFAQAPDSSYVGIFSDVNHSIWRVDYTTVPPVPTMFYAYIWWLPSVRGITGAEFAVSYPPSSDMIVGATTLNPTNLFVMGTLVDGITIAWVDDCKMDWTYSHRLTCYMLNANPNQIMIVEHPTVNPVEYHVTTCELGYPIEPVKRYTHLYLNWDGGIAVENTSWGAIKSLF